MSIAIKRLAERDGEAGENSLAFTLTKPIEPAHLDEELTEAMGWRKNAGIIVEGDPAAACTEEPVVVWLLRDDVTLATLRKVVSAHDCDSCGTEDPQEALADLRDKALAGEEYDDAETQAILRAVVLSLTRPAT